MNDDTDVGRDGDGKPTKAKHVWNEFEHGMLLTWAAAGDAHAAIADRLGRTAVAVGERLKRLLSGAVPAPAGAEAALEKLKQPPEPEPKRKRRGDRDVVAKLNTLAARLADLADMVADVASGQDVALAMRLASLDARAPLAEAAEVRRLLASRLSPHRVHCIAEYAQRLLHADDLPAGRQARLPAEPREPEPYEGLEDRPRVTLEWMYRVTTLGGALDAASQIEGAAAPYDWTVYQTQEGWRVCLRGSDGLPYQEFACPDPEAAKRWAETREAELRTGHLLKWESAEGAGFAAASVLHDDGGQFTWRARHEHGRGWHLRDSSEELLDPGLEKFQADEVVAVQRVAQACENEICRTAAAAGDSPPACLPAGRFPGSEFPSPAAEGGAA